MIREVRDGKTPEKEKEMPSWLTKDLMMAALKAAIVAALGVILEALTSVSQVVEVAPGL